MAIARLIPRDGAPATIAELRAEVEHLQARLDAATEERDGLRHELADRSQLLAMMGRRRPDPLHLSMDVPSRFREAEGAELVEPEEEPDPWTTRDKLRLLATLAVIGAVGFMLGKMPS